MMIYPKQKKTEQGFTLVEIIVSTAIFVTVVTAMLSLFNYTLQINRRVQALREVVQGTRTFAEVITREIRNGRIDYSSTALECAGDNYQNSKNNALAIVARNGDKLCFYFSDGKMYLRKLTTVGETNTLLFSSPNFTIDSNTFRFTVRPTFNPNPSSPPYPQIQPFVTIIGKFTVNPTAASPTTINYQTTISTDVYDTRK